MEYTTYPNYVERITTSNANITALATVPVPADSVCLIDVLVLGKRTSGSAGTAGDSAGYARKAVFKRVGSGAATLIGSVFAEHTAENQAGWDATLTTSGNNVEVRVTGALNNTVNWSGFIAVYTL